MSDETKNKFINLTSVRREDQKEVMGSIEKDGVCPFCPEHLLTYHKKPIIKEGTYWYLTDNQWPYEKIKHQLLAVYKKHINHIKDMEPEAGKELFELFSEETKKRGISGGGVAMRFGSSEIGNYGNSVMHLHAHLIEPDLEHMNPDERWKFKMGHRL